MIAIPRTLVVCAAVAALALWAAPTPAQAFNPVGTACDLGGLVSGLIGKACTIATHAGRIIGAGKKLLGGHVGGAIGALTGSPAVTRTIGAAAGLASIVAAVSGGARYLLGETAHLIDSSTTPQLRSTWFSASYWRMAGISTLLTLPFLFAAAIQAVVRGDAAMLSRAAFGYLPLAMLAIGIAAPLTMLLLAASDEMSALIAGASGQAPEIFLGKAGAAAGVTAATTTSLFPLFVAGLFTVVTTLSLWVELLTRQAAVYVIVLMLPLFFAALVWPARRVWAVRAVELLVALILSKFAIVAVLSLGAAAFGHSWGSSLTDMVAGASLVMLACLSPWALMRLLPLHELAGAAAGGLRSGARGVPGVESGASALADIAEMTVAARLRSVGGGDDAMARGDTSAGGDTSGGGSAQGDGAEAGIPMTHQSAPRRTAAQEPSTSRSVAEDDRASSVAASELPVAGSASAPPPPSADDAPSADRPSPERSPGMPPPFQRPNGGPPIILGGEAPPPAPDQPSLPDPPALPPAHDEPGDA